MGLYLQQAQLSQSMQRDFEEVQMLDQVIARPFHSSGIWNLSLVLSPMRGKEGMRPVDRSLQDAVQPELTDKLRGSFLF